MSHQLLLIDALNLIRRIFAVQQQRHTHIQAEQVLQASTTALENAAQRLLQQFKPSHVLAVFDGEQQGWRHQLYPEYKQNRKPMPELLKLNLELFKQALWQKGIDSLESEADEADDLIATLACKMAQAGQQSCIVSTDLGFCQLLAPGIELYDYFSRSFLDLQFVQQKYNLTPSALCDYWALTGISSLGIKGAKGIGPKRAKELLQRYGSLFHIMNAINDEYDEASSEKAENDKDLLRLAHQKENIQRALQLVRLKTDLPLGFSLKDIRYRAF